MLRSYPPELLTPDVVRACLRDQQCLIIKGAINAHVARLGFATLHGLMHDPALLARYPWDPETRLGYTPPGVETSMRNPKERDWNRRMFDFGPSLDLGDKSEALTALWEEAEGAARFALGCADRAFGSGLAKMPAGRHPLRSALYLVQGAPDDELFLGHKDFSIVTVFVGAGLPGLQAEVEGAWHAPQLDYGDVLIGLGTQFARFVPSEFVADAKGLEHRVVGGHVDRLSAFLFYELHDDVPLPHSSTNETYGEAMRRILRNIRADMAD